MVERIDIRPAGLADFEQLVSLERGELHDTFLDAMKGAEMARYLRVYARSVIFLPDEDVAAVIGLQVIRAGVGEAWALVSPKARKQRKGFIQASRECVEIAFRELALWRLQIAVRDDFEAGHHYAEVLGFKREAMLDSYLEPGLQAVLYSQVRE